VIPIMNRSSRDSQTKTPRLDWSRTPSAMFACAVLAVASISGLAWSWNRTIERDAFFEPIVMDDQTEQMISFGQSPDPSSLRATVLIDINSATAAQLDLLPGIGPALGSRIIADRDEHGRFDSIDSLQRVSGIGPKTVEKIRSLVIIGDSTNTRASIGEDG